MMKRPRNGLVAFSMRRQRELFAYYLLHPIPSLYLSAHPRQLLAELGGFELLANYPKDPGIAETSYLLNNFCSRL